MCRAIAFHFACPCNRTDRVRTSKCLSWRPTASCLTFNAPPGATEEHTYKPTGGAKYSENKNCHGWDAVDDLVLQISHACGKCRAEEFVAHVCAAERDAQEKYNRAWTAFNTSEFAFEQRCSSRSEHGSWSEGELMKELREGLEIAREQREREEWKAKRMWPIEARGGCLGHQRCKTVVGRSALVRELQPEDIVDKHSASAWNDIGWDEDALSLSLHSMREGDDWEPPSPLSTSPRIPTDDVDVVAQNGSASSIISADFQSTLRRFKEDTGMLYTPAQDDFSQVWAWDGEEPEEWVYDDFGTGGPGNLGGGSVGLGLQRTQIMGLETSESEPVAVEEEEERWRADDGDAAYEDCIAARVNGVNGDVLSERAGGGGLLSGWQLLYGRR